MRDCHMFVAGVYQKLDCVTEEAGFYYLRYYHMFVAGYDQKLGRSIVSQIFYLSWASQFRFQVPRLDLRKKLSCYSG